MAKLRRVTISASAFSGMLTISTPQLHLDFIRRLMHRFLWEASLCCTSRDHRRKWVHQSHCTTPLKWSVTAEKAKFAVGDGAAFLSAACWTDLQWGRSVDQILHFPFRQAATAAVWDQAPWESFINSLFQELLQRITFFIQRSWFGLQWN